jgi:hypothetical protein
LLIVCEGEKTEPNYFRAFRVTSDIYGEGLETMRLVEEAERINELLAKVSVMRTAQRRPQALMKEV